VIGLTRDDGSTVMVLSMNTV